MAPHLTTACSTSRAHGRRPWVAGNRATLDIVTVAPTVLHGVARGERLVAVVEQPSGEQAGFAGALAVAPVDPVLGQLRLNGGPKNRRL